MATRAPYYNTAYGLSDALLNVFPAPIVSKRTPTTADKAQIGTIWVDTLTNIAYVLTSIVNNSSTWTAGGNSGAGVFTSVTVNPGNLTVTAGNIAATAGSISAGTTVTAGTGITATTGNIVATAGAVNAGTTMTAGTGITATTGNITALSGNVNVSSGDVVVSSGFVEAGTLYATADIGGAASQVAFTNVTNTTQSSGALTILATSTGSNTNTGLLKIYIGTVAAYIPYFETIT